MNTIDRDINFYTGCVEKAATDLMLTNPDDEKKKKIYRAYWHVAAKLRHLKKMLEQNNN